MPIESFPSYIKIEDPLQATPKQYSFSEIYGEGLKSGLEENIISYIASVGTELNTRMVDQQEISQEDFLKHPSYRPGMQYVPGMNYDLMNQYSEHYAIQEKRKLMQDNSSSYYAPMILGALSTGVLDPVNWIPFGAYVKGGSLLSNAVRMGGANAAIEIMETPLIAEAYESRGTTLTPKEVGINIAMAATLGGVFAGGIHTARGLTDYIRGFGYSTELPASTLSRKAGEDFVIDATTTNLINRGTIFRFVDGAGTHVDNTNPFAGNKQLIIDTTGQIHEKIEDARTPTHATVGFSGGTPYIRGDLQSILQILPSIKKYLPEPTTEKKPSSVFPNLSVATKTFVENLPSIEIQTKINADVTRFNVTRLTKDQIDSWVTENSSQFKSILPGKNEFEPKLNQWSVLGTKTPVDGINYQLEFELKDKVKGFDIEKNIGKIYKIENGKRTLLNSEEKQKVYKEVFQGRLEASGDVNQGPKRPNREKSLEAGMKEKGGDNTEAEKNFADKEAGREKDTIEQKIAQANNKQDPAADIDQQKAKAIQENLERDFGVAFGPIGLKIVDGNIVKDPLITITDPNLIRSRDQVIQEYNNIKEMQKITKDETAKTNNCLESK